MAMIVKTTVSTVWERRSFWKPLFFITGRPPSFWVATSWAMLMMATSTKNTTALAWPGPLELEVLELTMLSASISVVLMTLPSASVCERRTARQGQVLVIELEAVGQRQEGADGDGRHDVRDGDMPQGLPAGSAVDLCGLEHILRDGLQTRDINDHHIADLLPAHQYDEAPEAVFCVRAPQRYHKWLRMPSKIMSQI